MTSCDTSTMIIARAAVVLVCAALQLVATALPAYTALDVRPARHADLEAARRVGRDARGSQAAQGSR